MALRPDAVIIVFLLAGTASCSGIDGDALRREKSNDRSDESASNKKPTPTDVDGEIESDTETEGDGENDGEAAPNPEVDDVSEGEAVQGTGQSRLVVTLENEQKVGLEEIKLVVVEPSGAERKVETDVEGRVAFENLAAGTYFVRTNVKRFKETETKIEVQGDETAATVTLIPFVRGSWTSGAGDCYLFGVNNVYQFNAPGVKTAGGYDESAPTDAWAITTTVMLRQSQTGHTTLSNLAVEDDQHLTGKFPASPGKIRLTRRSSAACF